MRKFKTKFQALLAIAVLFTFYFLHSTFLIQPVLAADSSQSATLQSELSQLKQEIASKAAALKSQIDKKIENKAIPGLIQSKTDSQIIITTTDRNQIVLIDKFTNYQYQGKVSTSVSKDDFVVALGDIDDKNNLVARAIVKMPEPPQDLTKYILGKVETASASGILMTQENGRNLGVTVSRNTDYQMSGKTASSKSVAEGDKIIAVGPIVPESGELSAGFIYIYPNPFPSQTASASAKPK